MEQPDGAQTCPVLCHCPSLAGSLASWKNTMYITERGSQRHGTLIERAALLLYLIVKQLAARGTWQAPLHPRSLLVRPGLPLIRPFDCDPYKTSLHRYT